MAKRKAPLPTLTAADIERFWNKVKKAGPDECWEWQASVGSHGYGQLSIDNRPYTSHTIAYYIEHGRWAAPLFTCHHCDNHRCCNPKHLFADTASGNSMDMAKKGRHRTHLHPELLKRGDRSHLSVLTEQQAREIRDRYAAGHETQRQLAREFGVAQGTISFLIRGVTWQHLADSAS